MPLIKIILLPIQVNILIDNAPCEDVNLSSDVCLITLWLLWVDNLIRIKDRSSETYKSIYLSIVNVVTYYTVITCTIGISFFIILCAKVSDVEEIVCHALVPYLSFANLNKFFIYFCSIKRLS